MGVFNKKNKPEAVEEPNRVERDSTKKVAPEPIKEKVEKVVVDEVDTSRPPSPDDVVINGKLFEKINYNEDGCSKSKLVEVK
jgi:hypothetical protein